MASEIVRGYKRLTDPNLPFVSRRGDPNKSDIWGNTPLHHAAANGHMPVLSFLVSFGANLFALDNDFHTAMDVAASRDRMDCVRFLDAAASQQANTNAKKVAQLKKEAIRDAERRVKLCEKVKKKHQDKMGRMQRTEPYTATAFHGHGTITGTNEHFSKLIAVEKTGSLSSKIKGTLQLKLGKRDSGTLQRSGSDGNVVFLKQNGSTSGKPEFLEVFGEQDETLSEEDVPVDLMDGGNAEEQVKQSIFNRPGLGGLIFMKKMGMEAEDTPGVNNENLGYLVRSETLEAEEDDDGSVDDSGDTELPWNQQDLGLDDDEDEESSPLDVFLSAISLPEFALAFSREHLDMEALMLCTDEDLKGIRIQLGPRKKILEAVARRRSMLKTPGVIKDSCL